MNEAINGTPVAKWRNQPNHSVYDAKIQALLDDIPSNLSAESTYQEVIKVVNKVRKVVEDNPSKHLNDLVF